jgi:hypothetical protein
MTFPWKSPENQPPGVGVITMNSPPVNSLGTELVTSFKQDIVGLFFFRDSTWEVFVEKKVID